MYLFQGCFGHRLWTAATIFSAGLTVFNAGIYLGGDATPRFLTEKGSWANDPWWRTALYCHVVSASVCLTSGTILMFPRLLQYPRWHRSLGYVYLNAVLWLAAPTGLGMALVAKGGILGTLGFAVAAIMWWQTTWIGFRAIQARDIEAHTHAMTRSYCLALSAPIFRALQATLYVAGLADGQNYLLSLWLSVASSLALAETCFALRRSRSKRTIRSAAGLLTPKTGVVS